MSTVITGTVDIVPDRTCRIFFEKPYNGVPTLTTVDEKIVDGIHNVTGNMTAIYDENNPVDVALYTALEAKIIEMRAKRDATAI
jgi:hypothetical protein